jgi:hypothetical protein
VLSLLSEVLIQRKLAHKNIGMKLYLFFCSILNLVVQVMDIFADSNEKLNIAMEYCDTDMEKVITNQSRILFWV